jgi:hypothetical protein
MLPATIAILLLAAHTVAGKGAAHPFVGHSDTGERLRILPPPGEVISKSTHPSFAPVTAATAVYGPSYGSGPLIDHGGAEMPNAAFYAIYWNASVSNSRQTSLGYSTLRSELREFINHFPDNTPYLGTVTDDFSIIQQYGTHNAISNRLGNWGYLIDTKKTASSITDSAIRRYIVALFDADRMTPSVNTIYGVYFPAGMTVTMSGGSSCNTFCGYHGLLNYGSMPIKYAIFPYPSCSICTIAGLTPADMLTVIMSHEIRESITDPGENGRTGWIDAQGFESDDKCAWHHLYQMSRGAFWVQPEYSNGGTHGGITYPGPGCVVPR